VCGRDHVGRAVQGVYRVGLIKGEPMRLLMPIVGRCLLIAVAVGALVQMLL
jgi:hypothetical protein